MDRQRFLMPGLVILAAIVSIALVQFGPTIHRTADDALTGLERAERELRWRLGLPQPGTPDLERLDARLADAGLTHGAAILVRIFKKESELELWMKKGERFTRFATYPICRWSGTIGPKLKEGDRQSPEGFYTVSRRQLNPNSRWHRSFNVGFPNIFDRSHRRTGSFIMVHGGCSSVGCFAVTNPVVDELWRLVNEAFAGGQKRFQVHVFPFRMSDWNLALHGGESWHPFWRDLKSGYDRFMQTAIPPRISVCNKRYVVRAGEPGAIGSDLIEERCEPNLASNS